MTLVTLLALLHANLPTIISLLVGVVGAKLHTKMTTASPAAQQAVSDGTAVAVALVNALQQSAPAPKQ